MDQLSFFAKVPLVCVICGDLYYAVYKIHSRQYEVDLTIPKTRLMTCSDACYEIAELKIKEDRSAKRKNDQWE